MGENISAIKYRQSMEGIVKEWTSRVGVCVRVIERVNKALAEFEGNKNPSPEDKKKIDELKKALNKSRDEIASATMSLEQDILNLNTPAPGQEVEKELVDLGPFLKNLIKKGGLPLGKYAVFSVDVDFDFKKAKLKKVELKLKFNF